MHGTDLELLRRYTEASDAEALAELVARNRDMVYAACYRVLGRRGDAEDAAQECFLQLAQSAGAVKVSVAGWLHRVAVRTALAMQRKSRARGKAEREAAIMLAGTRAEATWDDIKAEVDKAIDRLPVHLREPLALYFLQGRTQAATAQEIGVSQQAVSMRLKEAIERLRGHLRRSGLAVTVAGLTVLLETHAAEAAPATLVASLGKIALAGIAPAPAKAGVAGSVLGVAAAMGPGAKVLCVVAISLAAGVAIHQAAESRDTPRELPAVSLAAPEAFSDQLPANPPVNAVPTSPPPRSELLSAMSAADAADASRRRPNQSAHAPKAAESGRKLQPAADHGKPPVRMRPPADARPPAEADTPAADEAPKAVAGPIGVGHLAQLPGADGDQKPGGQMSASLSPTGAVEFMDEEGVVATLWLIGFGPTWNPGDQRRAFVGFPIPGGGEWATFAGEIEVPQVEGARVLYKQRSRPTDAGLELEYDVTVSDDMKFSGVRLALRLPVERLAGDAVVIEAADGELRTVTLRERRGAPALDHMDGCQIDVSPDPEPLLSVHLVLPFEATIGVQDLRIYGLDEYEISIMISPMGDAVLGDVFPASLRIDFPRGAAPEPMRAPEIISRPGVRLCRDTRVDAGLCEAAADVVATGKQTIEGLFPDRAKEEIRVHAVAATSWHENIATNRRETIYLRVNERGFGAAMRADAGPLGMLCQAVAELYNDPRIMGFDRLMAHRYLAPAAVAELGADALAGEHTTDLAQDGAEMLAAITGDEYAPVHPDFAAVKAWMAVEERLGFEGLCQLWYPALTPKPGGAAGRPFFEAGPGLQGQVAGAATDPVGAFRRAAIERDPELAAAFATYGEATALDLSADGTCLVASFEEDEAIRRAEAHPLHAVGDDLVLWVSPQVEMSRSDEWATHGTQSLRFASADPQTGIQVAVVDPDWEFSDWSRFSRFEMDLMVVADQPGGVEVHVMDDISGAHGRAPLFRGHAPPHEAIHISYDIGRRGLARQKHPQSECFIGPFRSQEAGRLQISLAPVVGEAAALYIDDLRLIPRGGRSASGPETIGSTSAQTTVNVAGQVLGPDGDPVEGAEVLVQYRGEDDKVGNQKALSDAAGRFSFDCQVLNLERATHVAALKDGLAGDWRYVKAGESVTLTLGAEAAAFSGTVKQPDGTPVEGARVHVHALHRPEDHPISKQLAERQPNLDSIWRDWFFPADATFLAATTDAAGQFRIDGLPPDDSVRITVETPGYERFRIADKTIPSDTQGYEVVIAAEAIVAGRVTHDGQPVAGILVEAVREHWTRGTADTGEDGSYRIGALGAGRYDVRVKAPEGLVALLGGPVDLEAGDTATGVDIALRRGGLIEGMVTDGETGEPVEEAMVFANGARASGHSRTDAQGQFSIRVPPGGYDVHCYPGSGGIFRRTEPMRRSAEAAEGGRQTGLDFRAWLDRPRLLRGRVVDVDGQPVEGVRAGTVHGLLHPGEEAPDEWSDYFVAETNAEGRFELPCRAPDYDWAGWPVLAMEPEQNLAGMALMPAGKVPEEPVEIVVERTGWIRGTVVDRDERPLPGVPIQAQLYPNGVPHGSLLLAGATDEQGRFSIGPLPTGARFEISPGGSYNGKMVGADHVRAEMVGGDDIVLEPIVVDAAGATIVGWVVDEQQQPVEGAMVGITARDETLTTDAEGRFEATGLPLNAKFWIVAVHPKEPLAAAEQIHPAWEVEAGLILWPPGGLEGMVVDQNGRPVAGAVVRVRPRLTIDYDDGGQSHVGHAWIHQLHTRLTGSGEGVRRTTTDNEGHWHIEGLIGAVAYDINVDIGDRLVGRAKVEVTSAEVTDAGPIEVELAAN